MNTIERIQSHFLRLIALTFCLKGSAGRADSLDNWTWRNPLPTGNYLSGVTYGSGRFVVADRIGNVLTSTNAIDWIVQQPPVQLGVGGIVFGNGRFLALEFGEGIWIFSDGLNWASTVQLPMWNNPPSAIA